MSDPVLIEAVPNFSEGRRPAVVAAIAAALQAPDVRLLDWSSDADHNRSVMTVVGPPAAVVEGLFRAVREAARHINLFEHRGAHPRVGAADVVPLAPIQNVTMAECVAWARELGRRIGEELALPVYLYEEAAFSPERKSLVALRRGEFEALLQEIDDPARRPDFGPARVGPAGAVIVGARRFLIAFNVFLKSSDVELARRIARRIRERNGGLPAVRALGLLVGGQAQVSMNLVDFRQTPPHVAVAAVAAAAAEAGVEIDRSELIGLVPQDAILAAAAHALHLPALGSAQILETAIANAIARDANP